MKIYCPSCNSEISAADVNLLGKIAKCVACNNVFSFSVPSVPIDERLPIGKPRNFKLERSADGLQIVRKWFAPAAISLAFFCLLWNGFILFWFYTAFKQKLYSMALFGSFHGAVGLVMLYLVLASFLNKTYIRIAYNSLTITYRPLPYPGQRSFVSRELKQLYSKEVIHYGNQPTSRSYSVQAVTKNGKFIELISGLTSSEEALFIEQEIEKYLKIEDEPVRGEMQIRRPGY